MTRRTCTLKIDVIAKQYSLILNSNFSTFMAHATCNRYILQLIELSICEQLHQNVVERLQA